MLLMLLLNNVMDSYALRIVNFLDPLSSVTFFLSDFLQRRFSLAVLFVVHRHGEHHQRLDATTLRVERLVAH